MFQTYSLDCHCIYVLGALPQVLMYQAFSLTCSYNIIKFFINGETEISVNHPKPKIIKTEANLEVCQM